MSRFLPSVAPEIRSGHAADLKAVKAALPYLWPHDDAGMRFRVVMSVCILLLTAILNALLSVLFAIAIDRLARAATRRAALRAGLRRSRQAPRRAAVPPLSAQGRLGTHRALAARRDGGSARLRSGSSASAGSARTRRSPRRRTEAAPK